MQFGKFHEIAPDCSRGDAVRASDYALYDDKTSCYRPARVFNDEARARNVSGTRNPWHSVFDGQCSHPRYAPASPGNRGQKCRQVEANFLFASFLGLNGCRCNGIRIGENSQASCVVVRLVATRIVRKNTAAKHRRQKFAAAREFRQHRIIL